MTNLSIFIWNSNVLSRIPVLSNPAALALSILQKFDTERDIAAGSANAIWRPRILHGSLDFGKRQATHTHWRFPFLYLILWTQERTQTLKGRGNTCNSVLWTQFEDLVLIFATPTYLNWCSRFNRVDGKLVSCIVNSVKSMVSTTYNV